MIFLVESLAIVGAVLAAAILFYKHWFGYWKRRGLEYLEPTIPFGNTTKLFTQQCSFGQQFADFYKQFKAKGLKHGGVFMFARPFYVPVDADIIKNMLIKDFQHFSDRGFFINEKDDPLSGHLFSLEGSKWKNLRAKLTQTFTSGKMKMMFDTMADTAIELENVMDEAHSCHEPINIKDILARFTTDVISSCAFGLEANSLKNPDVKFRHYGRRTFENTTWENIRNLIPLVLPNNILHIIKFKTTKSDVEDFMMNIVKKTVEYREKNNVYRKDFLHLLLQLKNRGELSEDNKIFNDNKSKEGVLTISELAAQVFVFFLAGFETSSTAMTFALYELAKNSQIQQKLHEEIRDTLQKSNNKISYDIISEMKYLDKVLNESLRKYPPLSFLNRICTKKYPVPGTNLVLEEGTMSVIPILAIQNDPDYYPNPEKFDPERFSEENKKERPSVAFMPFGDGPRNCIGLRFGLMQAKVGLVTLLRNYKVSLNPKTVEPLVIDPKTFISNTATTIYLDVHKIH